MTERDDQVVNLGEVMGFYEFTETMFNAAEISFKSPWERRVLLESVFGCSLFARADGGVGYISQFPFPNTKHNQIAELLKDFYEFEHKHESHVSAWDQIEYSKRKASYFRGLARDMVRRNQYNLMPGALAALVHLKEVMPASTFSTLLTDTETLFLLVCQENHTLVGLKGGTFWKTIKWPDADPNRTTVLHEGAGSLIANLPFIGRREMVVVPDILLSVSAMEQIEVPVPVKTASDHLEEAYYNQRYIIPVEGALIKLLRAKDLKGVVMVEANNMVLARAITDRGEIQMWLDLDNLEGFASNISNMGELQNWLSILSEVYRDMVIAVEKPGRISSRGNERSGNGEIKLGGRLGAIFIPRTYIRPGIIIGRPTYDGPPRPTTPHRVSGHFRHDRNMTKEQRLKVIEFEQKHGIKILDKLPAGATVVRPFVIPEGADLSDLPTFIKRRIETDFAKSAARFKNLPAN